MINIDGLYSVFSNLSKGNCIVLYGASGYGKSHHAHNLANYFKLPIVTKEEDLKHRTECPEKAIVFLDETQILKKADQELLLEKIDKGCFNGIWTGGMPYEQPCYFVCQTVYIFATTDPAKIIYPIRTRSAMFGLSHYTTQEIIDIISTRVELNVSELEKVAKRSKGIPRQAIRIAELYSKMGDEVFKALNIDSFGMDEFDRAYLNALKDKGRLSINQLSNALGVSVNDVVSIIEPFLRRSGLVDVVSNGRKLTDLGEKYFTELALDNRENKTIL